MGADLRLGRMVVSLGRYSDLLRRKIEPIKKWDIAELDSQRGSVAGYEGIYVPTSFHSDSF